MSSSLLLTFSLIFFISFSLVESKFKTILISFESFGWNLLDSLNVSTPNIDKLIENGVFAKHGIRNEFPPVTLPNHVTLVTGRHTDEHGIVNNKMFDPLLNEEFEAWVGGKSVDEVNFEKSTRWVNNSAEPIWVTIKRQSGEKSISMMWPLTNFDYKGYQIDKWVGYNYSVKFEHRIDQVVEHLKQDDYAFGAMFFERFNYVITKWGTESQELKDAMVFMDGIIGYLLERLEQEDLLPCSANIILTGAYGTAQSKTSDFIRIRDYATAFSSSYGSILPAEGREEEVWLAMGSAPHMRLYRKYESVPVALHFSNHRRIFDFIPLVDEGYYLTWQDDVSTIINSDRVTGRHEYDTGYSSMWPTFIASGPSFKRNTIVGSFNISQIYCLICFIHQVNPHPDAHCFHKETNELIRQTMRKSKSFKFTVPSTTTTTTTTDSVPIETTTTMESSNNAAILTGDLLANFVVAILSFKHVGTI